MTDSLTSLCDTFMTNSFPTIQRNIPSKRRNCLAKRHFSQLPFACGFWSRQKNWLSWALQPCWQTEWCQSRVYVRTLQVFCFCLTHLDHFTTCKTKTRGRKGILKLLSEQDSTLFDSIKVISWRIGVLLIQKESWHASFNGRFQRKHVFLVILYCSCRKNYQAFQTMFWDFKPTFSSDHDFAVQLSEKYTVYHTWNLQFLRSAAHVLSPLVRLHNLQIHLLPFHSDRALKKQKILSYTCLETASLKWKVQQFHANGSAAWMHTGQQNQFWKYHTNFLEIIHFASTIRTALCLECEFPSLLSCSLYLMSLVKSFEH